VEVVTIVPLRNTGLVVRVLRSASNGTVYLDNYL